MKKSPLEFPVRAKSLSPSERIWLFVRDDGAESHKFPHFFQFKVPLTVDPTCPYYCVNVRSRGYVSNSAVFFAFVGYAIAMVDVLR